jgi:molecular chaperone GrpE
MQDAENSELPKATGDQTAQAGVNDLPEPVVAVPESPPSSVELEELKKRAAKAQEHWDLLLRTTADFENFKKRVIRERQEAQKYAFEPLLLKLIPVLDNFDMALAAVITPKDSTAQSVQTGVAMIHQQLRSVLADIGLEEIDATGKAFDPNWHEAVSQKESAEVPEGQVVQQLRKGYKFRERLLRPATVVVAKRPGS